MTARFEGAFAVAQVPGAVNPKAAQLHRLGVPAARWRPGGGEFGDQGFEEVLGSGAGSGEVGFQLVDQGHELIDFGDYSALFGERWERERTTPNLPHVD